MPPPGFDALRHLVVLMLENRSFDHMLGGLTAVDPRIDGLTGTESNFDTAGTAVRVQASAKYMGDLDPDPDHDFPAVDLQIFNRSRPPLPTMQGFVKSYYQRLQDVAHSHRIMNYFQPDKLSVLTTLSKEFAVFNRWFSSIPGPTQCNRAFAHYGTSFGHVGTERVYLNPPYKSIYERLDAAGCTAKLYYFDQPSSTMEVVNLLQNQPQFFGTYAQFIADCENGQLPDYAFIEPNYSDHQTSAGLILASDQHPDHNVQEGERLIASVYNAIRTSAALWPSTALLVTYDEHGGIYDHVPPPACTPDGFQAAAEATGTGQPFNFDRLGVRVPAVLISPWIPKGTVVDKRVFEHASIPATVTKLFIGNYDQRSPREKQAETFLDVLDLPAVRPDAGAPIFTL